MIRGFEEFTKDLNKKEKRAARIMAEMLPESLGKIHTITNKTMSKYLLVKCNLKISGPRIRKILHYLRVTHKLRRFIGSGKGYYVATNIKDLKDYRDGLSDRIRQQQELLTSVEQDIKQWNHDVSQQERMPF